MRIFHPLFVAIWCTSIGLSIIWTQVVYIYMSNLTLLEIKIAEILQNYIFIFQKKDTEGFASSLHSWPKFKIILIKKVEWKSYYCPSFLSCDQKLGWQWFFPSKFFVMWSKTWMVVVFPIQVFGHLIKNLDGSGFSHPNFLDSSSFYHPTFLTVVFWQVFFVI